MNVRKKRAGERKEKEEKKSMPIVVVVIRIAEGDENDAWGRESREEKAFKS